MLSAKLLLTYLISTANLVGLNVDTSKIDIDQAYCLAKNIYYESGGEDIKGQFAVASVTINRKIHNRFPDTVCGVVRQVNRHRVTKNKVCAFSWYCEKGKGGVPIRLENKNGTINQRAVDQFQVAAIIAITVLGSGVEDNTHGATHFHNYFTSNPVWRHSMTKTMRVGNHDFYRE